VLLVLLLLQGRQAGCLLLLSVWLVLLVAWNVHSRRGRSSCWCRGVFSSSSSQEATLHNRVRRKK
jgi:hypothetical protein